ncbi:elongation factor G, partial [bacterium]|nr:elongation factor G [bacterium]
SSKVRLNQLYVSIGKNREAVNKLAPGDIGSTVKIKDTHTNHTLRSAHDEVKLDSIHFPEPRIRTSVQPVKSGDEEKMGVAINKLHEGDPTIIMEMSKELKQTLLHAQGGLHQATIKWLLQHEHGVEVEFGKPKIPYRETIRTEAKGEYKHKKQSGGSGQFGEVYLRILPYDAGFTGVSDLKVRDIHDHELPWGGNLMFCSAIVGGSIDSRFLPAILKGIMEVMEEGPLTSSYCRDVIVIVYDGKMHAVDSNEISFKIAGKAAFKDAFLEAKPMLLEPIYHAEVLVPNEYTGDVMTDLQGRRAMVEGIEGEGTYQKISARVPLAEMYLYANTLSSIAQGRAIFTREFLEYAQVPGDVQQKLVKELLEAEPA